MTLCFPYQQLTPFLLYDEYWYFTATTTERQKYYDIDVTSDVSMYDDLCTRIEGRPPYLASANAVMAVLDVVIFFYTAYIEQSYS